MKKKITIEEENNAKDNNFLNNKIIEKLIETALYLVGYALILILVSLIFKKSLYINHKYFGLYALLASLIIHILNQTIKPILVYITLPITAITYGLFYPIINVIILYLTSFILEPNFKIQGIFISFLIAIIISILNIIAESLIIKPIIYKRKVIKWIRYL